MSKPFPLPAKEKLLVLQKNDVWRNWKTLDDQRHCILCDQTFSGREIVVTPNHHGKSVLHCPTQDCVSTPREWMHLGDPLTEDDAWQDWLRTLDEPGANTPPLYNVVPKWNTSHA